MQELAVVQGSQLPQQSQGGALTAPQIRDRVNLIQQVMKSVMKSGTHYDTIPGTDKPTLLKAGAEVLMTTFQITVDPEVTDLSTGDEVRYRVRAVGRRMATGETIGVGIGECSSHEEKYKWRRAVCDEEFDITTEERRRLKFNRGKQGSHYTVKQIRTEPADVANTVLKMAKKRALVDFTLTALAASDIFSQDLEEMPEELRETATERRPGVAEPQERKPAAEQPVQQEGCINAAQVRVLRRKMQEPTEEAKLCEHFKVKDISEIPAAKINEALKFVETGGVE